LLKENPKVVRIKDLLRYDEYRLFKTGKKGTEKSTEPVTTIDETKQSPKEIIDSVYTAMRRQLANEIVDNVKKCSPSFFEHLVVELLVAMGYGGSRVDAAEVIGKSGDGGIDGIIKEDKLGLDSIYVQAKRWEGSVSRPTVQAFAGALEGRRARKGVLITTSSFTDEAKKYVENIEKKIVLIDGERLAELMIDFNIGVAISETYLLKKVDSDYFSEEG
jgi:restriction system protein